MSFAIKPLTPAQVDTADAILMAAFGKSEPRAADLLRHLELQPDGYFLASVDDQPAGMGGALDYGLFAYVGMLAVHPHFQRRGIARSLMAHILDWLQQRGAPAVWLDASPVGFPLYTALGFAEIEDSSVYIQAEPAPIPPPPACVQPLQPDVLPALAAFDLPIFGADRSRLLRLLQRDFPGRIFVAHDSHNRLAGYIVARGRRIGPWVASDPPAAEALLQAALALSMDGPAAIVTPAANLDAPALLRRYGFEQKTACRHMRLGSTPTVMRRRWIYAQTSYAMG